MRELSFLSFGQEERNGKGVAGSEEIDVADLVVIEDASVRANCHQLGAEEVAQIP